MRRGRKPRPDELDLWQQVARNVSPREHPAPRPKQMDQTAASKMLKREATPQQDPQFRLPQITGGKSSLKDDLAPALAQRLAGQSLRMDHKAYRKLKRGRVKPDARIDLHGMTLDRAHAALVRFVTGQHSAGNRLLLVITGKGKQRDDGGPVPVRFGMLRHQVPEWLRLQPLATLVLQVTQAHPVHGGGGAYYVYLRRAR